MTSPDPVQLTAPVDPAAYGARPRMMGPAFWIAMGFALLCILGGVAVVKLGPVLFPSKPQAPPAAAEPAATPSIDARLADIQSKLEVRPSAAEAAPAAPAAAAEIASLTERVGRLEADRRRVTSAAAGAVAAASLTEAAAASRPFAGELAAATAVLPDSVDIRALKPYAETGAPTLAALAAEYPEAAARAAVAARAHAQGNGFFAVIAKAIAGILTIRRTDQVQGKGVDAVLARAERDVNDGDLSGALTELKGLSAAGQDAMSAWRTRARRRLEIDRRVAAIRAASLANLTRAAGETGAP
jgi:hypothetical protein